MKRTQSRRTKNRSSSPKGETFGEGFYNTAEWAKKTGYQQDTISEYARKGKIIPTPQKRGNDWWIREDARVIRYRRSMREEDYDVEFVVFPETRSSKATKS